MDKNSVIVGLLISKRDLGFPSHAARLNDALNSQAFISSNVDLKVISFNDLHQSKLRKIVECCLKLNNLCKTVDVIHISYFPPFFPLLFLIAKRKTLIIGPNITGSSFPDKYLTCVAKNALKIEKPFQRLNQLLSGRRLSEYLNTRLLARADVVLSLSEFATDVISYRGLEKRKISVLPFASPCINNQKNSDLLMKRPVILFAGRLDRRKGFDLFLRVIELFDNSVDFLIVGDGLMRTELEEILKIKNNVKWLGKIPRSDLLGVLDRTTVYFQPSTYEAIATTVLESLVAGTPVVSANIDSHLELESYGGIEFFTSGDPEEAVEVLQEVIDNYESHQNAARKCSNYLSVDVAGSWLSDTYISAKFL